jgi:hypothetical protein
MYSMLLQKMVFYIFVRRMGKGVTQLFRAFDKGLGWFDNLWVSLDIGERMSGYSAINYECCLPEVILSNENRAKNDRITFKKVIRSV